MVCVFPKFKVPTTPGWGFYLLLRSYSSFNYNRICTIIIHWNPITGTILQKEWTLTRFTEGDCSWWTRARICSFLLNWVRLTEILCRPLQGPKHCVFWTWYVNCLKWVSLLDHCRRMWHLKKARSSSIILYSYLRKKQAPPWTRNRDLSLTVRPKDQKRTSIMPLRVATSIMILIIGTTKSFQRLSQWTITLLGSPAI